MDLLSVSINHAGYRNSLALRIDKKKTKQKKHEATLDGLYYNGIIKFYRYVKFYLKL